jgi:ribonuclease D
VRALRETRDALAEQRDVTPGRIIPDSAIVAAAQAMPLDRAALLSTKGFHGRGAERYAGRWVNALREVSELEERDLPTRSPRGDGPPLPRAWAEKDPVAARRLVLAREAMTALAEANNLPVENVLTPDYLRRTLWTPPRVREPGALLDAVVEMLAGYGARSWQIALAAPVIATAILDADAEAAAGPVIVPAEAIEAIEALEALDDED